MDNRYGYSNKALDNIKIIFYEKIYVLKSLRRHVLDWYHLYLNQLSGSRLTKNPISMPLEIPHQEIRYVFQAV